jgi:sulfopyruvate decarboxylase TPP-binding subunit
MNDTRIVFDHRQAVRENLGAQVGLCRVIATITRDSDLATEWNDLAAELDTLMKTVGGTNTEDTAQLAAHADTLVGLRRDAVL